MTWQLLYHLHGAVHHSCRPYACLSGWRVSRTATSVPVRHSLLAVECYISTSTVYRKVSIDEQLCYRYFFPRNYAGCRNLVLSREGCAGIVSCIVVFISIFVASRRMVRHLILVLHVIIHIEATNNIIVQ
jgi:hypothetical protein